MATLQEVLAALAKADAAGDTAGARQLAGVARRMQQGVPAMADEQRPPAVATTSPRNPDPLRTVGAEAPDDLEELMAPGGFGGLTVHAPGPGQEVTGPLGRRPSVSPFGGTTIADVAQAQEADELEALLAPPRPRARTAPAGGYTQGAADLRALLETSTDPAERWALHGELAKIEQDEEAQRLFGHIADPMQRGLAEQAWREEQSFKTPVGNAIERGLQQGAAAPGLGQLTHGATTLEQAGQTDLQIAADLFEEYTGMPAPADARSVDDLVGVIARDFPTFNPSAFQERVRTAMLDVELARQDPELVQGRALEGGASAAAHLAYADSLPTSDARARMEAALAADKDGGVIDALKIMLADPAGAGALMGEMGLESVPAIGAAMGATTVAGPGAGSAVLMASSLGREAATSADQFLQENKIQLRTPADALALLNNPAMLQAAAERGATRAIVITAFELLGQGAAARQLFNSPVGNALLDGGVQAGTGYSGEMLAQGASGQPLNHVDGLLEAGGELTTTPLEVGAAAFDRSGTRPPVQPIPPITSPAGARPGSASGSSAVIPRAADVLEPPQPADSLAGLAELDELLRAPPAPLTSKSTLPSPPSRPDDLAALAELDELMRAPGRPQERPSGLGVPPQPSSPEAQPAPAPGAAAGQSDPTTPPVSADGPVTPEELAANPDRFEVIDVEEGTGTDRRSTGELAVLDWETGLVRPLARPAGLQGAGAQPPAPPMDPGAPAPAPAADAQAAPPVVPQEPQGGVDGSGLAGADSAGGDRVPGGMGAGDPGAGPGADAPERRAGAGASVAPAPGSEGAASYDPGGQPAAPVDELAELLGIAQPAPSVSRPAGSETQPALSIADETQLSGAKVQPGAAVSEQGENAQPSNLDNLNDPAPTYQTDRPTAPALQARPVKADKRVTPEGREIDVDYAVVELEGLIASNLDDGRPNPAYPQERQPRDRSKDGSEAQVARIAGQLDPALLGENRSTADGAPIVDAGGVVESGNGRTLGLARAYARHPENAEKYRAHLAAQGYQVEGMRQPVLVAIRRTDMSPAELEAFTRESNHRTTLAMTATERAQADAKALPDSALSLYRGGDVDAAANRDFARAFIQAAVGANDQAQMIGPDGSMSQDAVRRIQAALLARAYGDAPVVTKLLESTNSNIRAIGGALLDVAGQWAQMRAEARAGSIAPDMDLTAELLEAVALVDRSRTDRRNLIEYVLQPDLMSGEPVSARAKKFLALMFRDRRQWTQPAGRERLARGLGFYVEEARKTQPGADMFGAKTDPDAIASKAQEVQDGPERQGDQADLLAQPPGGDGAGVRAAGEGRDGPRPNPAEPSDGGRVPEGRAEGAASGPPDGGREGGGGSRAPGPTDSPGGQGRAQGAVGPSANGREREATPLKAQAAPAGEQETTLDKLLRIFEADPRLLEAVEAMAAVPETHLRPGYGTDEYFAGRIYRHKGGELPGLEAAVAHMSKGARTLAWDEDKLPPEPIEHGHRATILIGPPAAGKSGIANPYARDRKASIVDADEAKKLVPEYGTGIGANAVHEESSVIAERVLEQALEAGENLVLPKVGANPKSIEKLVLRLKTEGYTVELVEVVTEGDETIRRMLGRFEATGRLIAPRVVAEGIDGAPVTYQILKQKAVADAYARIDNNRPFGEPKHVIEDEGGILPRTLTEGTTPGSGEQAPVAGRSGTDRDGEPRSDGSPAGQEAGREGQGPRRVSPAQPESPDTEESSKEQAAAWRAVAADEIRRQMPKLRAELDRLDLKRVVLEQWEDFQGQGGFGRIEGTDELLIVVGQSIDPLATLGHEAIHAMRRLNLFTPKEWEALEKAAEGWSTKWKIPERYSHLSREGQLEEAIAEEFGEALSERRSPKGSLLVNAFNKIARFLKAIRAVFTDPAPFSAEAIFDRTMSGEVGARAREPRRAPAPIGGLAAAQEGADPAAKDLSATADAVPSNARSDGGGARDLVMEARAGAATTLEQRPAVLKEQPNDAEESARQARLMNVPPANASTTLPETTGQGEDSAEGGSDQSEAGSGAQIEKEQRPRAILSRTPQGRAHLNAQVGSAPFIPDRRVWEELRRTGVPIWDRLKSAKAGLPDAVDRARVRFQDRFLPLLRAQQAVERAIGKKLPVEQDAYVAETTYSGKVGRHLFEIDHEFTIPIVKLIAGTNGSLTADDVGRWLYARHAEERNKRIASITGASQGSLPGVAGPSVAMPDGGSGMTTAEAKKILAEAKAGPHAARLERIGALIDQLRERSLKLRVEAGLLTPAEADLWRKSYQFYVPLRGFEETEHAEATLEPSGQGRRFNTRGDESKRALGRKSRAFNPLQAAITQAQEAAVRAEKNRVAGSLFELVKANPSPELWSIKEPKQKRVFNRTSGLVETRTEDPVTMTLEPGEMALKVKGKEVRILLHDERVAQAMGTIGADHMNAAMRVLSMLSGIYSMTRTMLSPEFVLTNAFRDIQTAQVNIQAFGRNDRTGQDDRAAIAKAMTLNWRKALAGAWRGAANKADSEWSRHFREFQEAGAQVWFWTMENPEAGHADLEKRIRLARGSKAQQALKRMTPSALLSMRDNPALAFIERANLAVDNAVRLAAFVEARKRGWSTEDAAYLAKELTVNFNRRGDYGSSVNAFYPFFNAALQGTTRMGAALTSKRVRWIIATALVAGIINDLVNAALSEEDDDGELLYDKIPDYRNERNFHLVWWGRGDTAAAIPMAYGFNVFPYAGQQIGKVLRGVEEPGNAFRNVVRAAFGAFSPINGSDPMTTASPFFADPFVEMAQNKTFTGGSIYPRFPKEGVPDAHQVSGSVTEASAWVADALGSLTGGDFRQPGLIDVSPETIDHLAAFVGGAAGTFYGRSLDLVAKVAARDFAGIEQRNVPVVRNLTSRVGEWTDKDRYFDFRAMVEDANADLKAYLTEAGVEIPEVLDGDEFAYQEYARTVRRAAAAARAAGVDIPDQTLRLAVLQPAKLDATNEIGRTGEWNSNGNEGRAPRPENTVHLDFNGRVLDALRDGDEGWDWLNDELADYRSQR